MKHEVTGFASGAGIGFTSVVFIGAFRGAGFAFICIPGIGFAFAALGFALVVSFRFRYI